MERYQRERRNLRRIDIHQSRAQRARTQSDRRQGTEHSNHQTYFPFRGEHPRGGERAIKKAKFWWESFLVVKARLTSHRARRKRKFKSDGKKPDSPLRNEDIGSSLGLLTTLSIANLFRASKRKSMMWNIVCLLSSLDADGERCDGKFQSPHFRPRKTIIIRSTEGDCKAISNSDRWKWFVTLLACFHNLWTHERIVFCSSSEIAELRA